MASEKEHFFLPGVTPLSVITILFGLVVTGFMIQVGNMHAGASFLIGGLFALPLRPVMFVVPLILISGLVFWLAKKSLYTRAELVCVLMTLTLAPPLMTEGFWRYFVGGVITIPAASDMVKLDGASDKMWPHGPNIAEGALEHAGSGGTIVADGEFSWKEMVVHHTDEPSLVPVLRNTRSDQTATLRVRIPVFAGDQVQLYLEEPYLLTLLCRATGLESESYYFCRIYYDDAPNFDTEVFSSREEAAPGYLHPAGFIRKGRYGIEFDADVQKTIIIELGLTGRGEVAFADLSLMNVSAIRELTNGRKLMSREAYDALPAQLRGRAVVRPDSMLSLAGIKLILSGCIPLAEWKTPLLFWFGYVFLLLGGTFAMAVIMRRQWIESERYPLPVAQIPIRLLGLDSDNRAALSTGALPSIWKNRLMWIGFGATLFWCVMKIWAAYNPGVPNLNINVPINPYFSDPSWGDMWSNVIFKVSSIFLAIGLFMELNVLGSIVLGFFLFRAQYWFGYTYGLTSTANYPFTGEQMNGSYIMYALVVLVLVRKYLWHVLKRAVRGGRAPGEEGEALSYRGCFIALILCYAGVAAWAMWAGLGVAGMLVFYTVMLLISLVATKLRAECGVPFSTYFPWGLMTIVPLMGGAPLFVPAGFIFIACVSELFVIRSFLLLPGLQFELIELGRRARVKPRHIVVLCFAGILGGLVVGGWYTLSNAYTSGEVTGDRGMAPSDLKTHWFRTYGSYIKAADQSVVAAEAASTDPARRVDGIAPQTWALTYGAGTVAVATALRQFFAGFWFHPIGLLVGPTWMAQEAWGSLLLAFLIRLAVLKLGGAATVREKLMPAATGIFLGGTAAYFMYAVTVSYLKFFVPGTPNVWWSLWAL